MHHSDESLRQLAPVSRKPFGVGQWCRTDRGFRPIQALRYDRAQADLESRDQIRVLGHELGRRAALWRVVSLACSSDPSSGRY